MVLPRIPGTIHATLFNVIDTLPDEDIFQATGKRKTHFLHASDPDRRERLAFEDAILLDALLLSMGLPARLVPAAQEQLAPVSAPQSQDLGKLLRQSTAELGDVHRLFDKALEDGDVSPRKGREIAKEAHEVIEIVTAIRDAMNALTNGGVAMLHPHGQQE